MPVHTALKKSTRQLSTTMSCNLVDELQVFTDANTSFSTSATVGARLSPPRRHLWNSLNLHDLKNRGIDHLVVADSGNTMVRRTVWTMGNALRHDREAEEHNRDIDHQCTATGNPDHRDSLCAHNREVDDLDQTPRNC